MVFMPNSPKGRDIEHVEGKPESIITRGQQITELGEQMEDAATTLKRLKDSSVDGDAQKGKAIEALRDSIDDSYEKLFEAAELYKPFGPVITRYGHALDRCKPHIDRLADDCEEAWKTFSALPGEVEPRGAGGFLQPEEGSPEAEERAEEDAAKKAAYEAWEDKAIAWDGWYDDWEDAFDTACDGISDATSGKIKDSFWSDFADVMGWVALVIGIAALIIGGPFLAGLAALAGLLYLVAVIGQYANGEADMADIALAGLTLLPFGKLAKLSTFTKFGTFAKLAQMGKGSTLKVLQSVGGKGTLANLKGLKTMPKLVNKDGLIGIYKNRGGGAVLNKLVTGSERGFTGTLRTYKSFYEGAGPRLAALRESKSLRNAAAIDFAESTIDNLKGHVDTGAKLHNAATSN